MKWIKTLLIMILFLFAILFSLQNRDEVSIHFGLSPISHQSWELPNLPIFLIILCSIFLGVLIGGIGDFYQRFQLKKALRQNEKVIERLSREIESLRTANNDQASIFKKEA